MTGASIRVEGAAEADSILASAIRRLEDPTDFFNAVGIMLIGSTQERFETESDPEGSPWPPSLRVQMEGGKTLTDTARLAGSITHETDAAGVEVGTNDIRAAIHQRGGVIRAKTAKGLAFRPAGANSFAIVQSVTMPKRSFLGIDEDDENEIAIRAGEFIATALGGLGSIEGSPDAR